MHADTTASFPVAIIGSRFRVPPLQIRKSSQPDAVFTTSCSSSSCSSSAGASAAGASPEEKQKLGFRGLGFRCFT